VKQCKFPNTVEAQLEPQDSTGHGLTETADHDVTQIINYDLVWIMGEYVAFVSRNWELYCEVMEGEINRLDISWKMM